MPRLLIRDFKSKENKDHQSILQSFFFPLVSETGSYIGFNRPTWLFEILTGFVKIKGLFRQLENKRNYSPFPLTLPYPLISSLFLNEVPYRKETPMTSFMAKTDI